MSFLSLRNLELTSHYISVFLASSMFSLALSFSVCSMFFGLGQANTLPPRAQKLDLLRLPSPANHTLPMSSPSIVLPMKSPELSLDLINASDSVWGGNATQLTASHLNCDSSRPGPNSRSCASANTVLLSWLFLLSRPKVTVGVRGGHRRQ